MDKKFIKIALTGGPCSGKTTALNYLYEKLSDQGWRVVLIPETATTIIFNCARDIEQLSRDDRGKYRQVQAHIIRLQDTMEQIFYDLARVFDDEKTVMICDRGIIDAAAYMTETEFTQTLTSFDYVKGEILDRYDGAIHLVTAADGAVKFYNKNGNPARREGISEACAADKLAQNAWLGHQHLRIIDNSTDFEGKLHRLRQAIFRFLGIPVPLEIERKFLLEEIPDLSSIAHQEVELEQIYLVSPDDRSIRIRKRTQQGFTTYYRTCKLNLRPGVRHETEERITDKEYKQLLSTQKQRTHIIRKKRRYFIWNNQYFELDVFIKPFENLCLLEIELTEENDKVEVPPFIRVAKEVTNDPRYSNSSLAAY